MAQKIAQKSKSSTEYWRKREEENLKKNLLTEEEYVQHIHDILDYTADQIRREINGFYTKYARQEGISLAEAKRRIKSADVEEFARKAKKYVKEKNFSKQANEEMRLYNATMKINRLELLKANIGLELVSGFDELQKYNEEILTDRTKEELERQAGILGGTIQNNEKMVSSIVNGSFHNATYSERIWMYQDMMRNELDKLLRQGLIQGKNPRQLATHLQKLFGTCKYVAERLMRTELARVQIDAQKQSFEKNGYEQYTFLSLGSACGSCQSLNGKHFDVSKMMPGDNAPPIHPNCRCSVSAYIDDDSYNEWLDMYKEHGLSYEEWMERNSVAKTAENDIIEPEDERDLFTSLTKMSDNLVERSLQVNNYLNSLALPESRWSGRTLIKTQKEMGKSAGKKKKNCDIWLVENASVKTIIHEHLHARSASRFPLLFGKYRYSEEAAVELMAEKICEKANIKYIPSYRKRTKALKQLNILLHVCDDEYDFAYFFFNIPMPERKKWIQNEVNNYIEKMKMSDTDSNKVINLMKDIIGDKAL